MSRRTRPSGVFPDQVNQLPDRTRGLADPLQDTGKLADVTLPRFRGRDRFPSSRQLPQSLGLNLLRKPAAFDGGILNRKHPRRENGEGASFRDLESILFSVEDQQIRLE